MKNWRVLLFVLIVGLFQVLGAQTFVIDNMDSSVVDSMYDANVEGAPSRIDLSDNHSDFVEGTGSMEAHYVIGEFHQWGSFGNLIYRTDSTETMDWTISDSFSIWIKVLEAPTHPEYMVFRVHIADRPTASDPAEEYIYENATTLDAQSDWFELKIPFIERETDGTVVPNDSGFVRFPDTWGGGTYNNRKLDRDKIIGYNISAVVSGYDPAVNLPADSVKVLYDNFTRFGARAVPFIIFNGMAIPPQLGTPWAWGQSSISVEVGAGATPGTNALKWIQGDEWGNGWTGIGFNADPVQNMLGGWMTDSIKFKLKAGTQTGDLRVQIESGADGKVGKVFTPIADEQWHDYVLALKDFVYQDGTANFDTTAVNAVGMMAEATGVAGNVVYIDDWWTGNPDFDVVPPEPPTQVFAVPGPESNLVTWVDVPGESGEKYNVYFSTEPISDVKAAGVNVVDYGWGRPEDEQSWTHLLYSPLGDSTVSYYYAVTCVDAAGNESSAGIFNTLTTNTAKGIPTLSLDAPTSFAADGNLGEWSSIVPFTMQPSQGSHIVTNTTVTNDGDLTVKAYLAGDAQFFYFAFDVTDDVVDTTATDTWQKDSPDLFLGLYNWEGPPHGSYGIGSSTPDYHFRFLPNRILADARGSRLVPTVEYYWGTKFPTGYVIEGKISWVDLAAMTGDDVFSPVNGYRIPIDFATNDADGGGVREGIMTWSPYNDDTSYQSPLYWLHSWVGNLLFPVGIGDTGTPLVISYRLDQNYPNPFNPMTHIKYSVKKMGHVQLDVYNTLGQRVHTLVDDVQQPGEYSVQFDARNLATGVYFYHLKTGDFSQIKKMVLLK